MRVGFLAQRATVRDGWSRYCVGTVHALTQIGVEPVLVTAEPGLDPSLNGIEHHVALPPIFRERFDMVRSLLYTRRVKRLLATCELTHCLVERYLPLSALSQPKGRPLIMTAHGTWAVVPLQTALRRWLFTLALQRVDLLLFQSEYTRTRMQRWTNLPDNLVLPAGVETGRFTKTNSRADMERNFQRPLILSVGALKERKGHEFALSAIGNIAQHFPDLEYVIIGNDISSLYAEKLRRLATKAGLSGRFHLLADIPLDELIDWYRRASVFVLLPVTQPDGFEGFGLAYLEAAAAGTPCVATLDCGAAESVVHGSTGFLVPQRDPTSAAKAIRKLLADSHLRSEMGQAGKHHAARFEWQLFAEKLLLHYQELVSLNQGQISL